MFDINRADVRGYDNRLLWNIWHELKQLNELLSVRPPAEGAGAKAPKKLICKVCKTEYDNAGKMLACLRRHKKEGK